MTPTTISTGFGTGIMRDAAKPRAPPASRNLSVLVYDLAILQASAEPFSGSELMTAFHPSRTFAYFFTNLAKLRMFRLAFLLQPFDLLPDPECAKSRRVGHSGQAGRTDPRGGQGAQRFHWHRTSDRSRTGTDQVGAGTGLRGRRTSSARHRAADRTAMTAARPAHPITDQCARTISRSFSCLYSSTCWA